METILISGGNGNLGREILRINKDFKIDAPSRQEMDIENLEQIERTIIRSKPGIFLHCAGLTRPMIKHDQNPELSVRLNIIGTSNVVLSCIKYNVKLVYISTDYVYPGDKGNYSEDSCLKPVNKYAWSKLGGEAAVLLYENSLILRVSFSERPFRHDKAFVDSYKSFLYLDEIAPLVLQVIKQNVNGIVNIGGLRQSVYDFAKISNPKVGMIKRQEVGAWVPSDTSMNTDRLEKILATNE
jgi:dTDP-4-dehydrorhamnose reductase